MISLLVQEEGVGIFSPRTNYGTSQALALVAALRLAAVPCSDWRSPRTDIDCAARRGPGRLRTYPLGGTHTARRSVSGPRRWRPCPRTVRAEEAASCPSASTSHGYVCLLYSARTAVDSRSRIAHTKLQVGARWSGSPTKLLIIESYRLLRWNFIMSWLAIPFVLRNQNIINSKFWCIW